MINFQLLRDDFPILQRTNRDRPLIYLDSSASSQKPQAVIDAITHYHANEHANIHRGVYELSERASIRHENVREKIKSYINAKHSREIIFVRGTTEAINLVAQTYGRSHFKAGDEIIISMMEHHSNLVPWQMIAKEAGAVLRVIPVTEAGELDLAELQKLISPRSKFIAIAHASNVLGTINPIKEIVKLAHAQKIPVLVDGAQAFPHQTVDVQDLDCDFYAFSSHKAYGPTGIGVLFGKTQLLENMPPYHGGGGMIASVRFANTTYAPVPQKFEAGTPDMAGVVGFGAALDYLQNIGMNNIIAHEKKLLDYASEKLSEISGLRIIGHAQHKLGVISFVLTGIHPHDIGTVLDHEGIAVRAGHHCAMPLMERFQVPATVRVSFGLYNTHEEIDALVSAIHLAKRLFA